MASAFDVSASVFALSAPAEKDDDILPDGTAIAASATMTTATDNNDFLMFMLYSSPGRE